MTRAGVKKSKSRSMISSRGEEQDAGKSYTEASGRVGNALFFYLAFYDKGISFIFIHYTVHLCFIYFSACFVFEIFQNNQEKSWRQSGCFITQGIRRQIWSLYIREYDARVELSLFTIIETWKVLKNKVEQEKKQRFIAQCYI